MNQEKKGKNQHIKVDGDSYSGTSTGNCAASVSCDFTAQGKGHAVAFIHGHTHADNVSNPDNYPVQPIGLCAALAYQRPPAQLPPEANSPTPRTTTDINNIAVTTLVYSPKKDEIKTYRLGAGKDYTVPLNSVIPEPVVEHAVKFTVGKGAIPFGNGLNLTDISKIKIRVKFDDVSGSQYLWHSSAGTNQRFYFGLNNMAKPVHGFGDKSNINSTTNLFKANEIYDIEWIIANGNDLTCTINGNTDITLSSAAAFAPARDITLATNPDASTTTNFKGLVYSLEFVKSDGTSYAKYDCNDGAGNIIADSSGNGRNITLSGEYSWVKI